ncbi:MAG: hypothetical protein JJT89_01665 [Nitriliruptoraceae bacterium]|nr:hypothetical protein [Nitriliruptoraceae bacterium]
MDIARTFRRGAAPALAALLLAACAVGGDDPDPIDLDSAAAQDAATEGGDDGASDQETADDTTDEGTASDGDEDAPGEDDDTAASDGMTLVDMTAAVAGTWPVGDAGTVTFSIIDGALVLDDVTAEDGWSVDIDEQDADEIEVDFRRGDVEWEIEIELEDGGTILEIEIGQDIENAEAGSYDIGDAGTFAFAVEDGRLVLTDLSVADGWTITERDEQDDEIEFELTNGPREFDVEVELEDDGTIEIEIDYEVVGPVQR